MFVATKPDILMRHWDNFAVENLWFMVMGPRKDLFSNLTKWFLCLNLTMSTTNLSCNVCGSWKTGPGNIYSWDGVVELILQTCQRS